MGEGMTPIVDYQKKIKLKIDYLMPTLSFKDRGAAIMIALCKQLNIQYVLEDSSGNAGNSLAAYAARQNIKCEIFVPQRISTKKAFIIKAHGAKLNIVNGDRDDVGKLV
jgi:threonine synthase